jgi:hypothetical protein
VQTGDWEDGISSGRGFTGVLGSDKMLSSTPLRVLLEMKFSCAIGAGASVVALPEYETRPFLGLRRDAIDPSAVSFLLFSFGLGNSSSA